jgi:uncharacterized hydrophobic protein (TIGR00271 family)
VVIGAMLISPLMNPILGLGFSLTLFDFVEMRRSLTALVAGALLAVLFSGLIVLLSPLKASTAEILARTRPNLFDLLVALFAALAGTFAIIRGRGETITGVAIATALMPPLGVIGYGLATGNMPVFGGALALFVTNFVTIALSATIMARLYGFGHGLSSQQGWTQTVLLVLVFVVMAVPLGFSLTRIGREAVITSQIRSLLAGRFGSKSRVTQLDVDLDARPMKVRAVVIEPRTLAAHSADVRQLLERRLSRPVELQLDQVLLSAGASVLDAQRAELQQATEAETSAREQDSAAAALVAAAAGVSPDRVMVDRDNRRIRANAAILPGATLESYRAIEQRVRGALDGWEVTIVPPLGALPKVTFAWGSDTLDDTVRNSIAVSSWAAKRWNMASLGVPGLPKREPPPARPTLSQRRALAIAAVLKTQGVDALPLPAAGQRFSLSAVVK